MWRRRRTDEDFTEEIQAHIDLETDRLIQQGITPEEARAAAIRSFGNVCAIKETFYESRRFLWLDQVLGDARYAFRAFARNPSFALIATLTLALGIGANTAIFSIVNAILLRPLPYKNSDRLVRIIENIPASESFTGVPLRTTSMNPDEFLEWRTQTKTLSHMALEVPISMTLVTREEAFRLNGSQVSATMLPLLGVQPIVGRVFEPDEEKPGLDRVVILSYPAWQKYFGADPKILERTATLDDTAYSVVGVMPREFAFPDPQAEFWMPLVLTGPQARHFIGLQVSARLKDGITIGAAAAEAETISRELRGELQPDRQAPVLHPPRIEIVTWKDELVAPIRSALFVFIVAVGFVLLIACVNVGNLFLARATSRNREMAIRIALGAGRGRVLRQLLTESLILALFGGAAGCALAFAGIRFFSTFGQGLARMDLMRFEATGNAVPRLSEISIDTSVLLYTLVITILTGLLFGLAPALYLRRADLIHAAGLRAAPTSSRFSLQSVRTLMVIGQLALTMVLLLGAGLLIRSFTKLTNIDLGYDPANVLTFKIPQPQLLWPRDAAKQPQQTAFAQEVVRRLQLVPGIQSAGFTSALPMVQARQLLGLKATPTAAAVPIPGGSVRIVSQDYLQVMGIRIISGRGFSDKDRINQRPVYLVNKKLAREYFKNAAIGETIHGGFGLNPGEIVGVVDDFRASALDNEPGPQLFMNAEHVRGLVPVTQGGVYFATRMNGDRGRDAIISEIRSTVRDIDSKTTLDNIATMEQIVSNSITTPRSYAVLLGFFAATAIVLAAIGIYGVLAYFVKQRTHEIGIRMALGAERSEVLLLILRQGLSLSIAGVALGLTGGVTLTRYLDKMLFGLTPLDPTTFIIVSAIFIVVTLVASYVPARYATKIDPLVSLRHE